MSRLIVDYGHTRQGGRPARTRGGWRTRLIILVVAALLLAAAGVMGRQVLHHLRAQGSAASHPGQLTGMRHVAPAISPLAALSEVSPSPVVIPASALVDVPYTVQAPNNNWKVHEESCEEAALLMYHDFLEGDRRAAIPAPEADTALRAMKAWQVSNWGAERDLDVAHVGELAKQLYGYGYDVQPATEENIRGAVAQGHPVVVPVMTHSLQNPNYGPKTVYHVLLIKGYTAAGVVSNDAGVKEGKDWFYSWSVLFQAIDAQTPKMAQGRLMLTLHRG